jgi:hypothetical protein
MCELVINVRRSGNPRAEGHRSEVKNKTEKNNEFSHKSQRVSHKSKKRSELGNKY